MTLQWGRGFAATEGRDNFRCIYCGATLQWGRGFAATEGRGQSPGLRSFHRASMGPWLRSHGRSRNPNGNIVAANSFNGAVASQPRKAVA